jgi:PPK2 family polyphosphate:nucleotide phosphotransferase
MNSDKYRVPPGTKVNLRAYDPQDTGGFTSSSKAADRLVKGIDTLRRLQERLYAQDRHAVLLIFQAMDAAGKDSAIKHVMSGLNPQGTQVYSFKVPSAEELDHDYMWRTMKALPERGRIGVFNRSYYEEVLVVRVHPEILARQRLPPALVTPRIWKERYEDIRAIERYLSRNGIVIRKFFLHVSKEEQRRRFLQRLEEPEKNWKFSLADVGERERWRDYMRAYARTISATSTAEAPWSIVPADHKWFARLVIADIIIDTLEGLKLAAPRPSPDRARELQEARRLLEKG